MKKGKRVTNVIAVENLTLAQKNYINSVSDWSLSSWRTHRAKSRSTGEEELERNELQTEKAAEEMSKEVTKALALQHPIMYKTYNICEIVSQSRLAKI